MTLKHCWLPRVYFFFIFNELFLLIFLCVLSIVLEWFGLEILYITFLSGIIVNVQFLATLLQ